MRMVLITLVVMLAGCQQLPEIRSDSGFPTKPGTDNYRFLEKEYENLAPGVEFVLIKNSEQQREVFKKVFGKGWKRVAGFTYWNQGKKTCRIFIPDPAWRYQPEIIGHEVAHCIWGRFHRGLEGQGPIVDSDPWMEQ